LAFKSLGKPIDINEVESVANLRKRFGSGSMSHGALSAEAHETLAVAMNRIGALLVVEREEKIQKDLLK